MKIKLMVTGVCLSALALGVIGLGLASAAPSNAPSSSTDVYTCGDGQSMTIVTNGQEMWTPGHVVAINGAHANATYIPVGFGATFYPDEPVNGQTSIEIFNQMKNGNRNGINNLFSCTSSQEPVSADDPENPYGVGGYVVFTATVFEAGNSH